MNGLASFLMSFCVSAIFIGAIFIICPNGKMSKPIKYIFSLVFTVILITAVSKTEIAPDDWEFEFKADTSQSDALKIQSAEYVWGQCLKSANINFQKITVCTNKTEDGGITISKVIIFSNENEEKIFTALGDLAKAYEVEIKNE